MRTHRLPVVDGTDASADLNGLIHFTERRNMVSACVCHHISTGLYQGLYPCVEIGVKCLARRWQLASCWHLVQIAYQLNAIKVCNQKEITGPHTAICIWIGPCGGGIIDHPPCSSDLGSTDYCLFQPLREHKMASQLRQMLMWSKLSPSGYRHLTVMRRRDIQLNINSATVTKWRPEMYHLLPCSMYPLRSEKSFWLNDPYSSPNIVRVVKSRRMRWAGMWHVWGRGEVCTGF